MIKRLLLIDDDLDDHFLLRQAVKTIAPSVLCETACNGKEGLEKLKTSAILPDIIFLDLNMPLMNGFEFIVELQSEDLPKPPHIIIYSTSCNEWDIEQARKLGCSAYFCKPSDFNTLCVKLKSIFERDFTEQSNGKKNNWLI